MWILIALYLIVGALIVVGTRAREEIALSIEDVTTATCPVWKVVIFRVMVYSCALALWPVFLKSWFTMNQSAWNALLRNEVFQEQMQLFDAMSAMCEDGCDSDELPNGYGEFGLERTNPIPTKTIFGSTCYLARLRAPDGAKVIYEREGSFTSENIPHPIDGYVITHPTGTPLGMLYLSPYHKKNSEKAPKGFTLLEDTLLIEGPD